MSICHVLRIDRIRYQPALELQLRIVERIKETEARDAVLLLLEHEPAITIGRSGRDEHLLAAGDDLARRGIELHRSSRGGDVTYHGPGQIVGYPILRLAGVRRDVHRHLRSLEAVLIAALRRFGIEGQRAAGLTGVWVAEAKVAAIGVALSRWITYHGFALNVTTDLDAFSLIVPCGIHNRPVTSMEKLLGRAPARTEVEDALVEEFAREFQMDKVTEYPRPEDLPKDLIRDRGKED
jgi:lipoate-protein ligase B